MSAKKLGVSPHSCPKCDAWSVNILKVFNDGTELLGCAYCDHEFRSLPHSGFKHLHRVRETGRWPRMNWSLGEVVSSRDHENALAKKLDMVPTDHHSVTGKQKPKKQKGKSYAITRK